MDSKPTIFIGSSSEGHEDAEAVQNVLKRDFECVLWEFTFESGKGNLENLVSNLEYDFAAIVLTKDDVVRSRNTIKDAPRDNLWVEIGLFIGALGRERVFIVHCEDDNLKIASDFEGVTLCGYSRHVRTRNKSAEVSPACTPIKDRAKKIGFRDAYPSNAFVNPYYESDLQKVDRNWKLEKIASKDTISIVIQDNCIADLLDREIATNLRREIDRRNDGSQFKRGIVLNYSSWKNTSELERFPVIAIGGYDKHLPLKAEIVRYRKEVDGKEPFPILVAPANGWGAYVKMDGFSPRVALWGNSAAETRATVESWIAGDRWLKEFLENCWKRKN